MTVLNRVRVAFVASVLTLMLLATPNCSGKPSARPSASRDLRSDSSPVTIAARAEETSWSARTTSSPVPTPRTCLRDVSSRRSSAVRRPMRLSSATRSAATTATTAVAVPSVICRDVSSADRRAAFSFSLLVLMVCHDCTLMTDCWSVTPPLK